MIATRINSQATMTSVASLSVHWEFHNGILACGSHEIVLSPLEGRFFSILRDAHGRVVEHGRAIEQLYGNNEPSSARLRLKDIVLRLRNKIEPTSLNLMSIRGWGYRLNVADATETIPKASIVGSAVG